MSRPIYVPLAEVVTEAKAGFACGNEDPAGVFQVRMNNITKRGELDLTKKRRVPAEHRALHANTLEEGDVLFNATNSPDLVGKTAIFSGLDEAATFSNHFLRLKTDPNVMLPNYLAYWLQWKFESGAFKAMCRQWVNQATVGRESLLGLPVRLPIVPEQRRAVNRLNAAKDLSAKRRKAITLLDDLTRSIFLEMFGQGFEQGSWPTIDLRSAVKPGTIVTYGIVQAGENYPGGVPYIRTGDIKEGRILSNQLRRTDPRIASRFERSRVDVGDIVMSIRATVGTTAPVTAAVAGANLTQGTARISPGESTTHLYLLHYLRSRRVQEWIERQVKGATFREITLAKLRELSVILAPMPLQAAFSQRIDAVSRMRSAQVQHLAELDAIFASLQHRAFRGEL